MYSIFSCLKHNGNLDVWYLLDRLVAEVRAGSIPIQPYQLDRRRVQTIPVYIRGTVLHQLLKAGQTCFKQLF